MTNEISYYTCKKEQGGEVVGAFSYDGVIEVNEAPNGYAYIGQKSIGETRFSLTPGLRLNNGSMLTSFFINKINKAEFDNIRAFKLAPTTHATTGSVTVGGSYTDPRYSSGGYPELEAYNKSTGAGKPVTLVGAGA
jgi:hypothetical protein